MIIKFTLIDPRDEDSFIEDSVEILPGIEEYIMGACIERLVAEKIDRTVKELVQEKDFLLQKMVCQLYANSHKWGQRAEVADYVTYFPERKEDSDENWWKMRRYSPIFEKLKIDLVERIGPQIKEGQGFFKGYWACWKDVEVHIRLGRDESGGTNSVRKETAHFLDNLRKERGHGGDPITAYHLLMKSLCGISGCECAKMEEEVRKILLRWFGLGRPSPLNTFRKGTMRSDTGNYYECCYDLNLPCHPDGVGTPRLESYAWFLENRKTICEERMLAPWCQEHQRQSGPLSEGRDGPIETYCCSCDLIEDMLREEAVMHGPGSIEDNRGDVCNLEMMIHEKKCLIRDFDNRRYGDEGEDEWGG